MKGKNSYRDVDFRKTDWDSLIFILLTAFLLLCGFYFAVTTSSVLFLRIIVCIFVSFVLFILVGYYFFSDEGVSDWTRVYRVRATMKKRGCR
jgi:hypothetical protein